MKTSIYFYFYSPLHEKQISLSLSLEDLYLLSIRKELIIW